MHRNGMPHVNHSSGRPARVHPSSSRGLGGARRHLSYSGGIDWTMPTARQPGLSLTNEHVPLVGAAQRRSHAHGGNYAWEPAEKGRGPRTDTCSHNSNGVMVMHAIVVGTFRVQ